MNLADGSRGSTTMDRETCAAVRLKEAQAAAALLGATFYPPICPDMEIAYTTLLLRKVAAVVRQAKPSILLTHSPSCYMEDHENACRLAVSAAFSHAMPNLESDPDWPTYSEPVTVYHSQPVGNCTPLGERVIPHLYVDVTDCIEQKVAALACHASQKQWLDESQGMDSFSGDDEKKVHAKSVRCPAATSTPKVGDDGNTGASVGPMTTLWPKPC